METVKERLAKLIQQVRFVESDCYLMPNTSDSIAELLIQNGVTILECGMDCKSCWKTKIVNPVQGWVSVDEPPKETGIYQVFMWDKDWSMYRVWYAQFVLPNHWFAYSLDGDYIPCEIIRWQPLPEPPKGVQ